MCWTFSLPADCPLHDKRHATTAYKAFQHHGVFSLTCGLDQKRLVIGDYLESTLKGERLGDSVVRPFDPTGHHMLAVEASMGQCKTTRAVEFLKALPKDARVLFIAALRSGERHS